MQDRFSVFLVALLLCTACEKESSSATNEDDLIDASVNSSMDTGLTQTDMNATDQPDAGATSGDAMVSGACSAENIKDYLDSAEELGDARYSLADEHGPRSNFAGSCGGEGNDTSYLFTAPSEGLWIFTIESEVEGLDTVLHARSDCTDADSQIACNDDIVPGQILLSQLRLTLASDESVYIFADTFGGSGGSYTLTARKVRTVAIGETCDANANEVGCEADAFCRIDPAGDGGEGVCAPDAAPVISDVIANRSGDTVNIQISARDSGADVSGGRLQLYNGSQRLVLNPENGADTFIMDPITSVFGEENFAYRYRNAIYESWPETTAVRVMLVDSQGNESEWVQVDVGTAPPARNGCDEHRILDACPEAQACLDPDEDGRFDCVAITAPTISSVKGYYDSETLLIGFEVDGVDPDKDVTSLGLELLGEDNSRVASGNIPFDQVVYEQNNYDAALSFRLSQNFEFESVQVTVYDREGLASGPRGIARLRAPRRVAEGADCDPLGARARCEDGWFCFPAEPNITPTCGEPPTSCPDDWGPIIDVNEDSLTDEWRFEGNLMDHPNVTSGSCGGGSGQAIYAFTAPRTGEYSFVGNSTAGGSDPVLYVRSHCGFDGEFTDFELGCNDDHNRFTRAGLVRTPLNEGQVAYVFVDGARSDDGPWRGPYTLVIRRLP